MLFYILHQVLGEEMFNEIIKSYYQKYYLSGATTREFIAHTKKVSGMNLNKLFNDWIFTTNYYNYLKMVFQCLN